MFIRRLEKQSFGQWSTQKTPQALGAKFPRGLLVHGPPGVGENFALSDGSSTGWRFCPHALNAGDIFGPYVGDTEARMRAAFRSAQRDGKYGKAIFSHAG